MVTVEPSKTLTLLWGATGEQEWTPALTTGKKPYNAIKIDQFHNKNFISKIYLHLARSVFEK